MHLGDFLDEADQYLFSNPDELAQQFPYFLQAEGSEDFTSAAMVGIVACYLASTNITFEEEFSLDTDTVGVVAEQELAPPLREDEDYLWDQNSESEDLASSFTEDPTRIKPNSQYYDLVALLKNRGPTTITAIGDDLAIPVSIIDGPQQMSDLVSEIMLIKESGISPDELYISGDPNGGLIIFQKI
jgi:hypothetical protein